MPEETLEGQPQGEDPLAAIGALLLLGEQWIGQEVAQMSLELGHGGLANGLSCPAAEGGQAGAHSGEIGRVHFVVSIYTHLFDTQLALRFTIPVKTAVRYRQLQRQLARLGYLTQGSVFERAVGQQGSRFVWTRKVKAKTVTVALSQKQFQWLNKAVANQRQLERIVAQMQTLSRQILFETIPGVPRRKRLSKKVLGLI